MSLSISLQSPPTSVGIALSCIRVRCSGSVSNCFSITHMNLAKLELVTDAHFLSIPALHVAVKASAALIGRSRECVEAPDKCRELDRHPKDGPLFWQVLHLRSRWKGPD